jgi:hypothetical protein
MGNNIWEFEHLTNGQRLTLSLDTSGEKQGNHLIWYNRFTTNARGNQQFTVRLLFILNE